MRGDAVMILDNDYTRTVLVVDDEPHIQRLLKLALSKYSFDVLTATSGDEAIMLVEQSKPSIILLDLALPGMNGYEVLAYLNQHPKRDEFAVIVISGAESEAMFALQAGADDFLSKPFRIMELLECLNYWMDACKQREAMAIN